MDRRFLLLPMLLIACEAAPAPETEPIQLATARREAIRSPDSMSAAMRVALERFRTTVTGTPPSTIGGDASSRDELIRRFADAVLRADTAALIRMTMNRAEFAYLYYPHSIYINRPYELAAADAWLLTRANSEKGLTRIIQRFGGKPFEITAYECSEQPRDEGPNRYWDDCTLTTRLEGAPETRRWFGSIWELNGQVKFVSFTNDL